MLPKFYPIVPDAAWVARLAKAGAKLIQLRIKDVPRADAEEAIRQGLAHARAAGVMLVVNDYWQEAIDCGAEFVHLGQEDLAEADLAALRKAGLKLGLSTHDHAELETALRAAPDYVALGPIYETKLKAMRFGPQGLEKITEWKRLVGALPLVAIGGITLERAASVYAAGADVISVVGDVVGHADPEQRVREWLGKFETKG